MKSRLFPLFISAALLATACDNESSLIIDNRDIEVDDPDAKDSDEGEKNTTVHDDKDKDDETETEEKHDEEEKPSEPCVDENDCTEKTPSCDICVADSLKCDGDNLLVCQKDDSGCLVWKVQDNCASQEKWCDSESKSCIGCTETCDVGTKKCTETGIAECAKDAHGCAVWNTITTCTEAEHCDDITLSCVSGCNSICHSGEKKCDGNKIVECRLSEAGCMTWQVTETCDSGKVCADDNNPHCDNACGDDCKPFSIIAIPDPQNYTASSKGIYKLQTQWIADNKEKENIRFVLHLGDMTDGNRKSQFERAIAAHDVLAEAGIPCAPATGNHDYKEGDSGISFKCRSRSLFGNYFNDSYIQTKYKDSSWFHGFKMMANMYATFNVGHLKFAVIALEFFPRKDALCWAENLLSNELKDHYVIITTHGYLTRGATENSGKYSSGSNGDIASGALGVEIYNELVSRHSNIIMVVSGHESGAEHRYKKGNTGNTIVEMLLDYQSEKPCTSSSCRSSSCGATYDAGNGWLRQLKIDPVNTKNPDGTLKDNVVATTFSVLKEYEDSKTMYCSNLNSSSDHNYYDNKSTESDHNFTFALDFTTPREYKFSMADNIGFIARNINDMENDATDGEQYAPSIAMNRNTGAFVAAWEDDADKDGKHHIMARGFCAGGCQEFAQFTVSTSSETQANPDVAMDKDGNFVVVWEERTASDSDIYMRGFDAKGSERFAAVKVNTSGSGNQLLPAIAMAPNGNFAVAWQDQFNGDNNPQIHIRGFKPDGTENFAERNVLDNSDGLRKKPDIGMAGDGSFVVTWEDDTEGNGVNQIIAKGFNADGTDRLTVFTVNGKPEGQQLNPSIAMNESGTFYIAFEDDSDGNKKFLAIAKGFDKNGTIIQKDTTLSASSENAADPVVCVDDTGKAIFAWAARALKDGDIQRRILTSPGKLKDEKETHRYKTGVQKSPAVGCTAKGQYVVLFLDDNKERGTFDIFGRGFNE